MKPIEVKILLLKKGLTFAGMANDLLEDAEASERSLAVMIADLFYGRRWYPTLASRIHKKYGIKLTRPAHLRPIRQQLKQAA